VEDVEIIVIDDGSATPVAIPSGDPRVRCFREEKPLGLSGARNAGLRRARGDWITFLDDDDRLLPDMIEVSLRTAQASSLPPPVAVISGVELVDESDRVKETSRGFPIPRGNNYLSSEYKDSEPKYKTSLMAPTEVLRSIGGWDPALTAWEHADLLIRLNGVCSIEGIARVTYRATDHSGPHLRKDYLALAEGLRTTLVKHRAQFAWNRRLHAWYLAEMSKDYIKAGRWLPAIDCATRSLIRNPRRPHAVRQLIGTLLGPRVKSWYTRNRQGRHELEVQSRHEEIMT
jgi:glycosyltransferase involved in cell wall biosynthesis